MSKNNTPQLSLDREDLDAQLEAAAQKRKKAKRKKIIIRIIVIAIILFVFLLIGGVIIGIIASKKAMGQMVNVTHTSMEEITQEVKISGNVQSDNVQHFYSPAPIKVKSVTPVGTFVKKGDPIVVFDEESYEVALREVELSDKIAENSNSSQAVSDGQLWSKLAEAKADVQKYEEEIKKNQEKVDYYEKDDALTKFATNVEIQTNLCNIEIQKYQGLIALESDPNKIAEYQKKIQEQKDVITNINRSLGDSQTDYNKNKSDLESNKMKLESAKSTVEAYQKQLGNSYDRENIQLQGELSTLKSGNAYEELQKFKDGCLLAPFDGIVTGVYVSEGMTTSLTGTEMIEFSSIDDVSVAVSVSKKDLSKIKEGQKVKITILDKDYEGEISRIARIAISASGQASVSAVIKINNPDDDIYLGIEAKNVIVTAHEDSCMTIPSEAINVDSNGYFVFVVNEQNIVEKKSITIGISSEERTQIIEGIDENDRVVSYVTSAVIEGATVVPVDEEQMNSILGGLTGETTEESVSEE